MCVPWLGPAVERYGGFVSNVTPLRPRPQVLEFFAGVGLARIGLERAGFEVVWSNDYEPAKYAMYKSHFGEDPRHTYHVGDVSGVRPEDLPRGVRLAWASSPCTDLSLAGTRSGLDGRQSSAFWLWLELLGGMGDEAPEVIVLENVTGLATSRGGDDLRAAIRGINDLGYSVDILSLDARRFLPQSRPRMFLVGAKNPPEQADQVTSELRPDWAHDFYGDGSLRMHRALLPDPPALRTGGFGEYVENIALEDERWWNTVRTRSFLASLSPMQKARLGDLKAAEGVRYRTAYRRTRNGSPVWEVRADDVSGCLRTARGGSSKQAVVRVGDGQIHVRWMTPTEYAGLMGAEGFNLEGTRTSQALFAFGDAVAVPAVEWLAREYLYPLATGKFNSSRSAPIDEKRQRLS